MNKLSVLMLTTVLLMSGALEARMDPGAGDGRRTVEMAEAGWDKVKVTMKSWWQKAQDKVSEWRGQPQPVEPAKPQPTVSSEAQPPRSVASEGAPQVAPPPAPVTGQEPLSQEERMAVSKVLGETKTALAPAPVRVATPGRAASPDLPKTKTGVPFFDLYEKQPAKGKKVAQRRIPKTRLPRLDIGEEPTISRHEYQIPKMVLPVATLASPKALPSPQPVSKSEVAKWQKLKVPVIPGPKEPDRKELGLNEMVNQEKVSKVVWKNDPETEVHLKPYEPFTPEYIKMLLGLILVRKAKRCEVATGIFHDLLKHKEFALEAGFELGVCAHSLGLISEAFERLLPVVRSEDPEMAPVAIRALVKDTPREFVAVLSKTLVGLKSETLIPDDAKEEAAYVMTKGLYAEGKYKSAAGKATLISQKSSLYREAQYYLGMSQHLSGSPKEAEQTLISLRDWLDKTGKNDKNMNSLIAINLARIQFQNQRFKEANQNFLAIEKTHSLWVTGLIEQGWTQLMMDDHAGAIGNMYSLHSPFFKAVYKPESFAVRTIGYLGICQYGDAYRTLTQLEMQHREWVVKVDGYLKTHAQPLDYYQTIKTYLRGKSDQDVDGLPFSVIREIARQRNFLNHQESLNFKEDERGRYDQVHGKIQTAKARLKARHDQANQRWVLNKGNLEKAKSNPALAKNIDQWKAEQRSDTDLMAALKYQMTVYEEARGGYLRLKATAEARMERQRAGLRESAGRALAQNLKEVRDQMKQILDNNELLRYEIFAGSGENIRYQAAGGQSANAKRIPAHVKPEKMLNWQFEGEYWEDEIGSYRSSLKNNCPNARGAHLQRSLDHFVAVREN